MANRNEVAVWGEDGIEGLLDNENLNGLADMAAHYISEAARWHAIAETRLEVISNLEKTVVTFRTLAESLLPAR